MVLEDAFAPTMQTTYGMGLGVFHDYCNLRGIEEGHHSPVNPTVLATFITDCIGTYSGSTIQNYIYGIVTN